MRADKDVFLELADMVGDESLEYVFSVLITWGLINVYNILINESLKRTKLFSFTS